MKNLDKKSIINIVLISCAAAYLLAYIVLVIIKFSMPESQFALEFFDK